MTMKFHFTYRKLYQSVDKLEAVLFRTVDLLSTVDLLQYFKGRFLIFASFHQELLRITNGWLLQIFLHLFDNFLHSRYNLNKTKKMKFELLIVCYVSFLNSLMIERQRKDRIFGVTKKNCERIIFGKMRNNFCICGKENSTFSSRKKSDQYKCNAGEYLGRYFEILKILSFAINNEKIMLKLLIVTFLFHVFILKTMCFHFFNPA